MFCLIAESIVENGREKLTPVQVRKSLYRMKEKGYIKERTKEISEEEMEVSFEFTKKGKQVLRGYKFDELKLDQPKKWDNKWRFVMFDVPEKRRYARDVLRDKLKKMGFFQVQQSVWVYPYDCGEEMDLVADFLGVSNYLLYFTATVERDHKLRKYFEKRGFKL